jgi:cell division septal protein FtsQ
MKMNRVKKGKGAMVLSIAWKAALGISLISLAIAVYGYLALPSFPSFVPLTHIVFKGNRHLADDELRALLRIRAGESLVLVSGTRAGKDLLQSPWIRSVNVRKEFPDTVRFQIEEAEPFALLDMNGHLFLVDERGKLLEELKDASVPFLPVITADPFKEKEGLAEALALAKLMMEKGFSSERDRIEIMAHKPHELTMTVDGTCVKMGAGGYEEKLTRLIRLEEDIKNMGIPIDYIDLRFERKAVVKPVTGKGVQ